MTKKEQAQALMEQIMDRTQDDNQRQAHLDELLLLKKAAKVSWEKLGVSQAMVERELEAIAARTVTAADMVDPLDEPAAQRSKSSRGEITRLVEKLVKNTELPYAEVVSQVLEQHPQAKTTARSVASVASSLRRAGIDVPGRRKSSK